MNTYEIQLAQANAIIEYLATKPFGEVHQLVHMLQNLPKSATPQKDPEEPVVKAGRKQANKDVSDAV